MLSRSEKRGSTGLGKNNSDPVFHVHVYFFKETHVPATSSPKEPTARGWCGPEPGSNVLPGNTIVVM